MRLMILGDPHNIVKEPSAIVFKPFHVARNAEALTRKSRTQNIVSRDFFLGYFRNVAVGLFAEVFEIRLLCFDVYFRRKDALHALFFESVPKAADA
jgi:hypothetical protein